MLDRCECAREVGVGEATAHRPVASADCIARRGGHVAVDTVAVGVRAGRFCWPAMKKCGKKKRLFGSVPCACVLVSPLYYKLSEKVVIFVSQGD